MSPETRYAETCVLIHAARRSADSETAIRAVAALLRERHPELLGLRSAESIAERFHAAYESLAPEFGYTTREASRVAWEDVPVQNRDLMVATVQRLLDAGVICGEPLWTPVAEGLPEEDGRYEVTERLYGAYRTSGANFHGGEWVTTYEVVAWRPAPTPWTGGKS